MFDDQRELEMAALEQGMTVEELRQKVCVCRNVYVCKNMCSGLCVFECECVGVCVCVCECVWIFRSL